MLAELDYLKPYWDIYPEDRGVHPTAPGRRSAGVRRRHVQRAEHQPDERGDRRSGTRSTGSATSGMCSAGRRRPRGSSTHSVTTHSSRGSWPTPESPRARGPAGRSTSGDRTGCADRDACPSPRWRPASQPDAVPHGVRLDRSERSRPADELHGGPLLGRLVDGCRAHARGGRGRGAPRCSRSWRPLAATKNVLLPVGTDYTPPNKWLTAIHRDWNQRYVWPRFTSAIPREFFDAVRAGADDAGRPFSPQTRDMNPIYTGKDVSFIDTKQAQRIAENTLLAAEKFATIAGLLGARFPTEAIDKAWRQLLFGAHHDGITGSESDQVYLDLIGGWREAAELGEDGAGWRARLPRQPRSTPQETARRSPSSTRCPGRGRTSPASRSSCPTTARPGIELRDGDGVRVPFVLETADRDDDGTPTRATIAFVARDVPALGYRTFRAVPSATSLDEVGLARRSTAHHRERRLRGVESIPPAAAPSPASSTGARARSWSDRARSANELRAYREYPNHPLFAEGPWHLTPDGRFASATRLRGRGHRRGIADRSADPAGRSRSKSRAAIRRSGCGTGVDRVELTTSLHDYRGHDLLFRVRFAAAVEGGAPVSEVGNAVVGRPFGRPNVDVAEVPFTLDHPAYNWFALGATARVALGRRGGADPGPCLAGDRHRGGHRHRRPAPGRVVRDLVVALVRRGRHVDALATRRPSVRRACTSTPTSPTSGSRLADPRRTSSSTPSSMRPSRRIAPSSSGSWRTRAGLAYGSPPTAEARDRSEPIPDLRGPRALPVLIVAGADPSAPSARSMRSSPISTPASSPSISRPQLDGATGQVEDYTVAIMNRGLPSFNVEPDGSLYLSRDAVVQRLALGRLDRPAAAGEPDGANFQFQHWSHTFEYALAAAAGDWRDAGIVQAGHDFNNPLVARASPRRMRAACRRRPASSRSSRRQSS